MALCGNFAGFYDRVAQLAGIIWNGAGRDLPVTRCSFIGFQSSPCAVLAASPPNDVNFARIWTGSNVCTMHSTSLSHWLYSPIDSGPALCKCTAALFVKLTNLAAELAFIAPKNCVCFQIYSWRVYCLKLIKRIYNKIYVFPLHCFRIQKPILFLVRTSFIYQEISLPRRTMLFW